MKPAAPCVKDWVYIPWTNSLLAIFISINFRNSPKVELTLAFRKCCYFPNVFLQVGLMYEFVKVGKGWPSRIKGKGTANSRSWLRNHGIFGARWIAFPYFSNRLITKHPGSCCFCIKRQMWERRKQIILTWDNDSTTSFCNDVSHVFTKKSLKKTPVINYTCDLNPTKFFRNKLDPQKLILLICGPKSEVDRHTFPAETTRTANTVDVEPQSFVRIQLVLTWNTFEEVEIKLCFRWDSSFDANNFNKIELWWIGKKTHGEVTKSSTASISETIIFLTGTHDPCMILVFLV